MVLGQEGEQNRSWTCRKLIEGIERKRAENERKDNG